MDYMLVDTTGNALDAFSDRTAAEKALLALVADDRAAASEVTLLAFDRRGVVVGEAIVAADLRPEAAVSIHFEGELYQQIEGLTFFGWPTETVRSFLTPVLEVTNPAIRVV